MALKYSLGIIAVIALVGALTVFQDYRSSYRAAKDAELQADDYQVGIEYPGIITRNYVRIGDHVVKDQVLATIKSSVLISELTGAKLAVGDLNYPLNENGEVVLRASRAGTIDKIDAPDGSFVSGNKEIYDITSDESRYIVSRNVVSNEDLKLLNKDRLVEVTLYNGEKIQMKIRKITINKNGSQYIATIESTPIVDGLLNDLIIGMPLQTRLVLKPHNLWTTITSRTQVLYNQAAGR